MTQREAIQRYKTEIDNVYELYLNAFKRINRELSTLLREKIIDTKGGGKFTSDKIARYTELRRQAEIALRQSGFDGYVRRLVTEGYKEGYDVQSLLQQRLAGVAFTDVVPFTDVELTEIREADYSALSQYYDNVIKQAIVDIVRGATSKEEATSNIKKVVEGKYENNVARWVETGFAAFTRSTTERFALEEGIKYFLYAGPKDSITRPFCAKHIGDIRTIAEWKRIRNPSPLPTIPYLGGYRCRHTLIAVSEVYVRERYGMSISEYRSKRGIK